MECPGTMSWARCNGVSYICHSAGIHKPSQIYGIGGIKEPLRSWHLKRLPFQESKDLQGKGGGSIEIFSLVACAKSFCRVSA